MTDVANAPAKALEDREDGETWTEDGVTYEMTFGAPTIVGFVGYEEVAVDDGTSIDWLTTPLFVGSYRGTRTVPTVGIDGETNDQLLHLFTDKKGRKFSAWGFYQLDKGLAEAVNGAEVVIEFLGVDNISKGRTMKRARVLIKQ